MNLLVLSPHRDDAAFSLSLSLAHWLAAGHKVTLLNAFTRSSYAPYAVLSEGTSASRLDLICGLRKREDQAFLQTLGSGTSMIDLDLEDAPIRLRCEASVVCDMEVVPHDPAIKPIAQAVGGFVKKNSDAALLLPLGLGHHVDHRTARDAALPFSTSVPCAFYEDLPYATRPGVRVDLSRFRKDTARHLHENLSPVLCHGTHTRPVELKRRLALLYASQIDAVLADTIAGFSRRYAGAERLWANEGWIACAAKESLSKVQRDESAEPLPA